MLVNSLHTLGSIGLGASTVITGGLAALTLGRNATEVRRLSIVAVTWLLGIVILGALGVFNGRTGFGTYAVGVAVALPVLVSVGAYLSNAQVRERVAAVPTEWLIAIHATRILGVLFLLLHAQGSLRGPFGPVAGWGDVIIGLLALPIAWLLARQAASARTIAATFTAAGTADLFAAVSLGIMSEPDSPFRVWTLQASPVMSELPWLLIPAFLVPIYLIAHAAAAANLFARSDPRTPATASPAMEHA